MPDYFIILGIAQLSFMAGLDVTERKVSNWLIILLLITGLGNLSFGYGLAYNLNILVLSLGIFLLGGFLFYFKFMGGADGKVMAIIPMLTGSPIVMLKALVIFPLVMLLYAVALKFRHKRETALLPAIAIAYALTMLLG